MLRFSICQHTYQLRFKAGFSALCAIFLLLFVTLGVWQLHRYHFKKNLIENYEHSLTAKQQNLLTLIANHENVQFKHVSVSGQFVNDLTMLVQNRVYNNQLGFEVLTPLKTQDGKLLLIDRGWIAKPANQPLPLIPPAHEVKSVEGYIKLLNEPQFILGQNILDTSSKPLVMQKIDVNEISQITHQIFFPFMLRLNESQPNGFVRDWVVSTVLPERHMGYAVQWFSMALMLLIAYFCFCCERIDSEKKS
jgi:surfeit locus 1 family protein